MQPSRDECCAHAAPQPLHVPPCCLLPAPAAGLCPASQTRVLRGVMQGSVWGSGLAGAVCAACALASGSPALWRVGFVASFVSKLSDTVSSEIGKVRLHEAAGG